VAGLTDLDGVVWVDPVALEDLVWVSGDVRVPGRPLRLSDATTTIALELDAYLGAARGAADRLRAAWAARVVDRFLARRPGLESFALAASSAGRDGHLGLFLVRRKEQRIVHALGLDRSIPSPEPGELPLLAAWSSSEATHVGAFVSTRIRHEISIRPDGSARVQTQLTFDNGAAAEPPSILLGGGGLVPIGTFAADVGLLIPAEARQVEAETSRPGPIEVGTELGYTGVRGSVSIRAGTSATLTASYLVRDALVADAEASRLVVRVLPQPSLEGISYAIRIELPEGAALLSASQDLRLRGDALTFSGTRTSPFDLALRLA
ncbi:MAG TPA: hypothetical protein VFQ40_07165, partial [Actinomycetota bacterium]|nr:hypothetical protein [Actinomycetota bacterium]